VFLFFGVGATFLSFMPSLEKWAKKQSEASQERRLQQTILDHGKNLAPVDTIEIDLLEEAADSGYKPPEHYAKKAGPGVFPIYPYGRYDRILSSTNVSGEAAENIAAIWRQIDFAESYGALCHEPVYGLRFFHGGKMILETSLCWKCRNLFFPHPSGGYFWCGFDARGTEGQKLLKVLQIHAPFRPQNLSKEPTPSDNSSK